ncbi:MAG: hypothetical protein ACK5Q5_01980 [Planctomycetaceae bacterium]
MEAFAAAVVKSKRFSGSMVRGEARVKRGRGLVDGLGSIAPGYDATSPE